MKKSAVFSVCHLLFLLIGTYNANAQWVRLPGPVGGAYWSAAFGSIGKVFAASNGGGVFVSDNLGASWRAANEGLMPDMDIMELAVNGDCIYARYMMGYLFVSTDEGAHWMPANERMDKKGTNSLAVEAGIVFAGTDSGIFLTKDNNETWTGPSAGIPKHQAVTKLFAAKGRLFATVADSGLYVSTDTAKTWKKTETGLPAHKGAYEFAVAGDTVFAVIQSYGLFQTVNYGAEWTTVDTGSVSRNISNLALRDTVLMASIGNGIYQTPLRSFEWIRTDIPAEGTIYSITADGDGACFIGCSYGGLYRSLKSGSGWEECGNGLAGANVNSLQFRDDAGILCATGDDRLFRSDDKGATWETIGTFDAFSSINNFFSTADGALFASTMTGYLVLDDNATSWHEMETPAKTISVATSGNALLAACDTAMFRSDDYGESWVRAGNNPLGKHLKRLATERSSVFAISDSNELYRLNDDGSPWSPVPVVTKANDEITEFIVKNNAVFALTRKHDIFMSEDRGANWKSVNEDDSVWFINDFLRYGNAIFAATTFDGIFLTTDDGAHWKNVNEGLMNQYVHELYEKDGDLFATTSYGGIWSRPVGDFAGVSCGKKITGKDGVRRRFAVACSGGKLLSISYVAESSGLVHLGVYDVKGALLRELAAKHAVAGNHTLSADIGGLPAGCYAIRLLYGKKSITEMFTIIR